MRVKANLIRLVALFAAFLLWPPMAGSASMFLINGLGGAGAFTELPSSSALRSLKLAAAEGFKIGVFATPFISLIPATLVFVMRRWLPRIADLAAGALGALAVFVLFIVYTTIHPLDPLLGGIAPLILGVLLISGMITSFVIATLRPRATLATPPP